MSLGLWTGKPLSASSAANHAGPFQVTLQPTAVRPLIFRASAARTAAETVRVEGSDARWSGLGLLAEARRKRVLRPVVGLNLPFPAPESVLWQHSPAAAARAFSEPVPEEMNQTRRHLAMDRLGLGRSTSAAWRWHFF
ncbi:MAG TPA: hypothetical protein VMI06_04090 [Terriglobia bacterium]|nr:hypothetical protein [Terriglobia bacterium]